MVCLVYNDQAKSHSLQYFWQSAGPCRGVSLSVVVAEMGGRILFLILIVLAMFIEFTAANRMQRLIRSYRKGCWFPQIR